MKIQRIATNSINTFKRTNLKPKTQNITFTAKNDREFGFFDGMKLFFNKKQIPQVMCYMPRKNVENLSDKEIRSENIKSFVGTTLASYAGLDILGKNNYKEINSMLRAGAQNFYEGTTLYNEREGINLTFKESEETHEPEIINVWEKGKFAYSYNIHEKEPLKYQLTVQADNLKTDEWGTNRKLTRFLQVDTKKSEIKEFEQTENGFNYLYGTQDENGNITVQKRLYFDFNDINGCIYAQNAPEGIYLYIYNPEQDIWEERYLLELEKE